MGIKSYYNTILSQTYSPCGNYLVVGDIHGQISVFNLQKIISPEECADKSERKPKNTFLVLADIQINSLLTTESYLVVGTVGEIAGYNWKHVTSGKDVRPTWKIELPSSQDTFEKADINCMIFDRETDVLHAGCSDNLIYAIHIETGQILHTLNGHTDYIHCIRKQGNDLISGGEDGLVNIWDIRAKQIVHKLEPHSHSKLQRSEIGKWIGAVDINDDWLLCGGGPRLSLWHYRSLNMATVFPIEDRGIHVGHIYHDKVLAGGRCKNFYQMSVNGDIVSVIPTSSVSCFSAAIQEKPFRAMCLSGSSPHIDICSNFNYKDQVLTLNSEI